MTISTLLEKAVLPIFLQALGRIDGEVVGAADCNSGEQSNASPSRMHPAAQRALNLSILS